MHGWKARLRTDRPRRPWDDARRVDSRNRERGERPRNHGREVLRRDHPARSGERGPAIRFAVDNGAKIINLSFNLALVQRPPRRAIQDACARGALVVITARDAGSNNDQYALVPARYATGSPCGNSVDRLMATNKSTKNRRFELRQRDRRCCRRRSQNREAARTLVRPAGPMKRIHRYTGTWPGPQ